MFKKLSRNFFYRRFQTDVKVTVEWGKTGIVRRVNRGFYVGRVSTELRTKGPTTTGRTILVINSMYSRILICLFPLLTDVPLRLSS